MIEKVKIQEISDKIRKVIENSPISDINDNIHALLQGMFAKLDLISREEFDVQTQVLKRTREKLEALEAKIESLETKSKK
ncbi:MAG: accessory factor UbiK family protein [Nitrosomonadales bacterium]|jgi:BMFP domain-containing protein YqiC|nr:MAG: phosphoheptose isomerase [Methylophilales bacterium BACL14 MAG-120910-bin43]KRP07331.1 MAG: phosphoheptose isomerase [Methylophilales bacterium BACL14 MAG-120920-bin58]MBT6392697.1 accessory factor UbiK family protein [Nitrosomonadales bacterium]|tara:strand:- start:1037 stop:1276 length:240 start_codon:yes stop_codon:yes gene_type:complete